MQVRLTLAVLVVTFAAGQQARAAKPHYAAKEQARERQAKTACLSGDYVKGVSILAELFVETEDPTFLYNQGRCYEQNVRYVEAAERLKEYLRKAGKLSASVRDDVNKHIADCEAAAAKNQPRVAAEPPPAPVQSPAPVAPGPALAYPPQGYAMQPAATATNPTPAAALPDEHPWQHTAKWIATGAAAAFLGLGIVEHARYYSKNQDYNNDPTCGAPGQCKDLADAADTAHTVAIVGYSAAALAAGLAITFWLTDSPRTPSAQHAGISVTCAPTLAGAACGGRF